MPDNRRMAALLSTRLSPANLLAIGLALAVLPACSSNPGDDDDTGSDDDDSLQPDDDDTSTEPEPELSVPFGLYPLPGTLDVSPRTVVFADASKTGVLSGATLTITDSAGSEIPVEISEVSSIRLVGRPLETLSEETDYTVTVSFSEETPTHEWSFTTGLGLPTFGGEVPSLTHQLSLGNLVVISPAHFETGSLFGFTLPKILFQVSEADGSVTIVGGAVDEWGEASQQSVCQASWSATDGVWVDPHFEVGSFTIPVLRSTKGQHLPISPAQYAMYVSRLGGSFDPGVGLREVEISGHIDIRDLGMGDACQLMMVIVPGTVCEACPGEPESLECVYLWGIGGTATVRPDIQEITELTTEEIVAGDCYPESG